LKMTVSVHFLSDDLMDANYIWYTDVSWGDACFFSSPELKAHVSYSDCQLSVVCPSVRLSVNFYIFDVFSRTTGPISTRLGTNHPWVEGFQVSSNEGDRPSPRGDNSERVKMHWKFLKIFSRTSRSNSIKLGTNYPWIKGIQVYSNKGPGPLQRGDNHKNVKMGLLWVI
jgi:hypothetical protein